MSIPVDIELIVERDLKLLVIPIPNLRYQAHTEAYLSGDLREINFTRTRKRGDRLLRRRR
ncbi:MAG: hypothetical protein KKB77_00845 [Bacteroidetes bacterium]|nr:hypothetical protein [Bacteroidota bacterium]